MLSAFAIGRSAPFFGSVTNTRCARRVAERRVEPVADDEILRHRLGRAAGLGGHDEQRALRGPAGRAARRSFAGRRCRARAAAAGRRAPRRSSAFQCGGEQRGAQRDRAERRAADAEHDDVVELSPRVARGEVDRLLGAAPRRRAGRESRARPSRAQRRRRRACAARNASRRRGQSASRRCRRRRRRPSCSCSRCGASWQCVRSMRTVSPSNAGAMPRGSSASRSACEVVVRQMREVRALGADRRAPPRSLRECSGASDARCGTAR